MQTRFPQQGDGDELTAPVSLTLPGGRLNPAAIGWARQPLVDTAGIGGRGSWGRNKRWEYWNVMTPRYIVGITVSSLDYAAVHEVWVFDRRTEEPVHESVTLLPARGVVLPPSLGGGPVSARAKNLEIDIVAEGDGERMRVTIPRVTIDVVADMPARHERLAVVVPWSDRRFQYTVKDVARPARGTIVVDGEAYELPDGASWAVLDHGRGRWPYDITWNWGAGSGTSGGAVIGIQVGGRWTDGTGATENAFFVDGRMHKIHDDLVWEYDQSNFLLPWSVHGGGLEAQFAPFYDRVSRTDLGVISAHTDQCFGVWSGTFVTLTDERIAFEGIEGWAEHVHNRW